MESEQIAMFSPDPVNNADFKIPRINGIDHDNLPASEQVRFHLTVCKVTDKVIRLSKWIRE